MGKRIVITGIARGLGRAMCDVLIQQDHTIIGCSRSPEAIESLKSRYGSAHTFSVTDVSDADEVAAWADTIAYEILARIHPSLPRRFHSRA